MLVSKAAQLETCLCPIAQYAKQIPNQAALIYDAESLNYLTLHLAIEQLCKQLQAHLESNHLSPSMGFGIQASNRLETVLCIWAAARLGIPLFLIPPSQSQVQDDERFKQLIFLDDWLNTDSVKSCLLASTSRQLSKPILKLHKPFTWIQSSGSSAKPKWVCHTLNSHIASAQALQLHCPLNRTHTWACVLPLHHISGLATVFRCGFSGACLLLSNHYKDTWWHRHPITHISLVVSQLEYLFPKNKAATLNTANLNTVLLGGSPLIDTKISQHLAKYAKKSKQNKRPPLTILKSYGLTETASQICVSKWPNPSNGQAHHHSQLKCSKSGIIYIKSPSLSCGYLNTKGKRVPITDTNGWFKSNDIGKATADGWIITGRADNMFICGGENIQPEYIEAYFLKKGDIKTCFCIPLKHVHYGHCPVLFIQSTKPLQELQKLAKTLKPFQRPQHYLFMPDGMSENPKHWRKELISRLKKYSLDDFKGPK